MKRFLFCCCVVVIGFASSPGTFAQTTFSGVLLSGRGEGLVAGSIHLTVQQSEVTFRSMLLQGAAGGAGVEAALVSQNKVLPLAYTNGIAGSFQLGEFLGPIPGWDTTPPCGWDFTVIDPGFALPVYFDGVRYTGSFTTFPGFENLLRAKGGIVLLQMRGGYAGMQDPLFTALLVEQQPSRADQFVGSVLEPSTVIPGASPLCLDASFSLSGNCLTYGLSWEASAGWHSVLIEGRAGPHTSETNLVADISSPQRIRFNVPPGGPTVIFYQGAVALTDEAVKQLKLGKLHLSVTTPQSPGVVLRSQILPVAKEDRKLNPK